MKYHNIYSFTQVYISSKHLFRWGIFVLIPILISACSTAKYVKEGEYLFQKEKVVVITEKKTVKTDLLEPYIYQKTNRKMLFNIKFYLGLYSLSGRDTTKWINKTLRRWGEPPVILDTVLAKHSAANIKQFMQTRGFYYAEVVDSIKYKKRKAEVIYIIKPNSPYLINSLIYDISDASLLNLIQADSLSSNLKPNRRLSNEVLDNERERITTLLKNKGYYAFNKGYINFEADTTIGNSKVDLTLRIDKYETLDTNDNKVSTAHSPYKINEIYINTNYDPIKLFSDSSYLNQFDTLVYKNIHVIYKDAPSIRPGVIPRASLLLPQTVYNEDNVSQTYNNFSNLGIYRSVTIQFKELNEVDSSGYKLIDCIIQLNPIKSQAYKLDFEVSSSSSELIGFSPGLHYDHRNLFKGAELFSLDFRGVFQYSYPNSSNPRNSFEYNVATSISFPKFLAPISIAYFKRQLPHTRFKASYIYQNRPDYTRSIASFSYGYTWNNSSKLSFIYSPIDFNMVKMLALNPAFLENITNPYLKHTYEDHFVLGATGSVIYNSQTSTNIGLPTGRRQRQNNLYMRFNIDIAGNVLSLFNPVLKKDEESNAHNIFSTRYAQYIKGDFNITYTKPVLRRSTLAYRFLVGIGKAYGNSNVLPFEKMFFSGGIYSLRGWSVRNIGPGSSKPDPNLTIPNQVADMRLEVNAEFRFPLFWLLEGATFLDAGNIWSINKEDDREDAKFKFDEFYKQIAANSGLGIRLNLTYFVIRLDTGFKFHDPSRTENKFIVPNKWLKNENYSIHFGINYPF